MSTTHPDVEVCSTQSALAGAAAERVVAAATAAMRVSDRFVVALSGGSTPRALYALLATPAYRGRIDWARVHVFWGDERCVPPDDAASNYRMAHDALLDSVPVPATHVHRIHGEDTPPAAAAAYEGELRALFGTQAGPPPVAAGARFDLVLLGMGDDGHTASLFPRLTALRERDRWVVAEYVAAVSIWRVTLTPVIINAAAEVIFLVAGDDKAATLARVLEGPRDPDALPAQIVAPYDGRLTWLVDAAAATNLRKGGLDSSALPLTPASPVGKRHQ